MSGSKTGGTQHVENSIQARPLSLQAEPVLREKARGKNNQRATGSLAVLATVTMALKWNSYLQVHRQKQQNTIDPNISIFLGLQAFGGRFCHHLVSLPKPTDSTNFQNSSKTSQVLVRAMLRLRCLIFQRTVRKKH